MIESAPEIPLTGKCLIDAEEALDLLDKIRNAIPEEVKRAEWLTSEKDRVIREGQAEAERIVLQAEEYVSRMVHESEILRKAQDESERMLEEARVKASEMQAEADQYAQSVLGNLEAALEKTLQVVRKGKEELGS